MARWIVIPILEPRSLRTTARNLVAPILSISDFIAKYLWDLEQDGFDLNSEAQFSRISGCSRTERCAGINIADGLMEIANKHAAENPDKRTKTIFEFCSDRSIKGVDGKSITVVSKLFCNSPPWNVKPLIAAIEDGFGPELADVRFILEGNELEMLYCEATLFKSEVKAAEYLIQYAIRAVRNRWLKRLYLKLIDEMKGSLTRSSTWKRDSLQMLRNRTDAKLLELEVKGPGFGAEARLIKCKFEDCSSGAPSRDERSSDWGKRLSEELVQYWLEGSIQKGSVEFKCSASSAHNVEWKGATPLVRSIEDYVCARLRESTSPDYDNPVTIRIAHERDYDFLTRYDGPPSHDTLIMQNTGAAEGTWVSISDDAEGPGPWRVLICRASNFEASLSEFSRTTDPGKFTSLKGYKRVDNGKSDLLPSSDSGLPDLSIFCPEDLAAELMTEGSASPLDERFQAAVTQSECVESNIERFSGINFTDGLIEIANKHVAEYPDKRTKTVFRFFTGRAVKEIDEKFTTVTQTLSCTSPLWNLKALITAIDHGFRPELESVRIIVDGDELELRYRQHTLFKSNAKAANSLIPYAIRAARNRWLRLLQSALIEEYEKNATMMQKRKTVSSSQLRERNKASLLELGVGGPAVEAEARLIKGAFFSTYGRSSLRGEYPSDWGKRLTEELVQYWLEGSIQKGSVEFKCLASSPTNAQWAGATPFVQNIEDYVRARLRERTSPDDDKPVIIRIGDERNYNFCTRRDGHDTIILQSTDGAKGTWVSISDDAAGSGPRRVLICRPSNFTASLSEFLKTTDPDKFISLKGYKQVDNKNADFLPSSGELMTEGSGAFLDERFARQILNSNAWNPR